MAENVDKDTIVNVAMNMIVNAGDARNCLKEALKALSEGKTDEEIEEKFNEARHYLNLAHIAQTDLIQRESRGEECQYSMLLTHAQDTLMTIKSEMLLSEELVMLYRSLCKKLKDAE